MSNVARLASDTEHTLREAKLEKCCFFFLRILRAVHSPRPYIACGKSFLHAAHRCNKSVFADFNGSPRGGASGDESTFLTS